MSGVAFIVGKSSVDKLKYSQNNLGETLCLSVLTK